MARARIHAVLKGGPHDGDRGAIVDTETPPEFLWTWECSRTICPVGIHWYLSEADAPLNAELYVHDEEQDDGFEVYVWKDLKSELSGWLREAVDEPVPA